MGLVLRAFGRGVCGEKAMIRIRDLSMLPGADELQLKQAAAKQLRCGMGEILSLKIVKKSVDARKKKDIRIIYTLNLAVRGNEKAILAHAKNPKASQASYRPYLPPKAEKQPAHRPIVVGFGPGGIFAALLLAEAGLKPLVLERGADAGARRAAVEEFWSTGRLNPISNVQFGEGGAGMFSDGKLNTGIKDYRIGYVLNRLVEFGAGEDILSDAKPHVGTDVLYRVIQEVRRYILSLGGEIRFLTKLTGLKERSGSLSGVICEGPEGEYEIEADTCILAIGHSARDTFRMLEGKGLSMEPKPFSMGVRVEHLQSWLNEAQYGEFAGNPALPPADYKLSCHLEDGSSAYSFCMCPGGYVVAAASEEGRVVTNGMSLAARNGKNCNSALLVTLRPEDFPYGGTLGGLYWQEELESAAFRAAGNSYRAPAQLLGDFLENRPSTEFRTVEPSYRPGVTLCNLRSVLPKKVGDTLADAIPVLNTCLQGFDNPDAVLTGPETRSSSPVRILRDENCVSSLHGLFPCGEGAGYAGGIMSAAVDGLRCAEAVIEELNRE